jgi:hypothetical protein
MARKTLRLVFPVVLLGILGCEEDPVAPQNRNPVILSLTVFPNTISSTDSAIVVCNATDPDANALVYDWITDARLKLKGAPFDGQRIYNSSNNYQVVYPGVTSPSDSAWVQCVVRDGIGGGAGQIVTLISRP